MEMKMAFALTVVVALAGIVVTNLDAASAYAPRFLTLEAADHIDFLDVHHLCNFNNMSCQQCYNKATQQENYDDYQIYCTNKVYTYDCGGEPACYCIDYPDDCDLA